MDANRGEQMLSMNSQMLLPVCNRLVWKGLSDSTWVMMNPMSPVMALKVLI